MVLSAASRCREGDRSSFSALATCNNYHNCAAGRYPMVHHPSDVVSLERAKAAIGGNAGLTPDLPRLAETIPAMELCDKLLLTRRGREDPHADLPQSDARF
jgi:hypothetical protein